MLYRNFSSKMNYLSMIYFFNIENKSVCCFSDVEYLVQCCVTVPTVCNVNDNLYDEFVNYLLLKKEDIPSTVWESALVKHLL